MNSHHCTKYFREFYTPFKKLVSFGGSKLPLLQYHVSFDSESREIIMQTCAEMDVHIVKGVLGRHHVHMFLLAPPKLSLSTVMQCIKRRSSRQIQMEFPELRKRYWGRHF